MFERTGIDGYEVVFMMADGNEDDVDGFSCPLEFVPRVGEHVDISSDFDCRGDPLNKDKGLGDRPKTRDVISGVVTAVNHIIEERGRNSAERHWHQSFYVFLKSIPT